MCDRDAWGLAVRIEWSKRELRKMISVVAGFLLTETECERNFSVERRQHGGRPRMDPGTRFSGLKIMIDGAPFSRLQVDGRPTNNFWRCCQDRYAQGFGAKRLGDTKRRSDVGKHHLCQKRRRDGKFTIASVQRARKDATATPTIPFGSRSSRTVFGHQAMSRAELERVCRAAECSAFTKIIAKMNKNRDSLHDLVTKSLEAPAGSLRLSAMSAQQRRRHVQRHLQSTKVLLEFGFMCKSAISSRALAVQLQGSPLVLLEEGATDGLVGRGLDEVYVGKPLGDHLFRGSCADYVGSPLAPNRRIILVKTLAHVPEELHIAAMLLGARVQQQVLVPGLRFIRQVGWAFACTREFRRAHAAVARVLDGATRGQSARVMSIGDLAVAWGGLRPGQRRNLQKRFNIFYVAPTDKGLAELPAGAKSIARTLAEFSRTCQALG